VLGYTSHARDLASIELLVLTRAARRGVDGVPLVGDLPFGSYEPSDEAAVATARRFVDEGGCDAVKLEGAGRCSPRCARSSPRDSGGRPRRAAAAVGRDARRLPRAGTRREQALAIIADGVALEAEGAPRSSSRRCRRPSPRCSPRACRFR
jgi:3-methyl-2-oxobutanoate hydroxymethyltransferase